MKHSVLVAIGTSFISAQSVMAEVDQKPLFSLGGVSISGYADLSYFDDETNSGTFARADIDLTYLPNRSPSSFSLGFSLGFDGAKESGSGGINSGVFYPAVLFDFGDSGRVSVGAPRSVMNRGYIPTSVFALNSRLDLQLSPFTDSVVPYLALAGDYHPYGIRYDTAFGNTEIGISFNRISDSGLDADFYAMAFSHKFESSGRIPELDVFGAVERIDAGAFNTRNYSLGIEAGFDNLDLGFRIDERNLPMDTRAIELYGRMQFTTALSTSASVININPDIGSSVTVYGIAVEYLFVNNTHFNASYSDGSNGVPRNIDLSVGWRF
ncbi:hypothetical protein BAR1_08210 [Profundibacter amoris]|uniref:Uncharacterized protein n=1 Tax=Profundibacter amoris TaxID=2171755 RepID=A0A347UGD8_9RHOB|nr:hypothetical protein BAR1_08210 [Profundibacter amoris]